MGAEFKVIDHYLMVKMPEEIDHHQSGAISSKADAFLLKDDVHNIVFDFEETRFMDSSGIGVIMGRYRQIQLLGGKVCVVHANERMKKILNMSGMTKIIQLYEEEK